jgi:allantoin racemase
LESYCEDALAVPDLLNKVQAAAQEGVDAVIIDCMADPGLEPARELASIPVVGAAQASMHLAAILAHRFSVVSVLGRDTPITERLAFLCGLEDKLASTRPIDIPVLELTKDRGHVLEALIDQSATAGPEGRYTRHRLQVHGHDRLGSKRAGGFARSRL